MFFTNVIQIYDKIKHGIHMGRLTFLEGIMDINTTNEIHAGTGTPQRARAAAGLIALGIILLIAGVHFAREVILSLKSYHLTQGIIGSPWVGLDNYRAIFEDPHGIRVIFNTLIYNLLFAGFCFIISLIAGSIINSLPRRSIFRDSLAVLAMLPVFIPAQVYTAWFIDLIGAMPFTRAGSALFLLPFISALKYAGIPIMVTHILGILKREKDILLPMKCAGLFSLTAIALAGTGHFSIMYQLVNPLIMESADILDTFTFRTGFMQMNFGVQAAAGILQILICLAFLAMLFVPLKKLFQATFNGEKEYSGHYIPGSIPGSVLALAIFVLLFLIPYILSGKLSGFSGFQWMPAANSESARSLLENTAYVVSPDVMLQWVFVSLTAALLCTGIAFAAGSFAGGGKTARMCGVALLTAITLLTVQSFTISGYLSMRSFGMINTYMAIIVASMFSSAAVWAFAAVQGDERMHIQGGDHATGITRLLFVAIGIFLIQTALTYGNGTSALLYIAQPGKSPLLMYQQLVATMHSIPDFSNRMALSGSLGISGLMLSLPPVLIFIAAKVLLPLESMLAVIAAGRKQ